MNRIDITPPNKNHAIEAFRFLFICVICLWHCHDAAPWLHHGYIAVEFYFILSGYFIYMSWLKHRKVGVLDFTWKRVRKFYIPFILSVILLMILDRKQYFCCFDWRADGILTTYFSHFHEYFFCQSLGLTNRVAINHPLWFISVLLFGGGILYSLLCNFQQKAISLYIPLLCLFGFSFILDNGNHAFQNQMNLLGVQAWMIRGLADMGLGILTAYILQAKSSAFNKRCLYVNILGWVSLIGFCLMTVADGNYDYLAIFFIPLILCSSFIESSWFKKIFKHKIWNKLGGLSMYMYFIHLFVASVYWIFKDKMDFPSNILLFVYLVSVVLTAYLLKSVSCKLSKFVLDNNCK